ncbi:hypothetical protein DQC29_22935 [Salmonella enterica subsp. enterica serovar Telelkebir]|nr:hypothetical protein [Salmonella enterica subsp. enterica serovar Telelkebir]
MAITLVSQSNTSFEIIKATDVCFLLTTPHREEVFTLYHCCDTAPARDRHLSYEDGKPAREFGLIPAIQIEQAWSAVLASTQCFCVKIVEYVGEMEFSSRTVCCAPSLPALWSRLDEEMQSYRGDGQYLPESETWDYGETMACVDNVYQADPVVIKEALRHRLISLWLWVS